MRDPSLASLGFWMALDARGFMRLVGRSGRGDACLASYASRRLTHDPMDAVVWAAAATSLKLESDGPFRGTVGEIEARAAEIRANA